MGLVRQNNVEFTFCTCTASLLGISLLLAPDIQTRTILEQEAYPLIINQLHLGAEYDESTAPQKAYLATPSEKQGPDGF